VGACAVDLNGTLIIPRLTLNDPLHPGVTIDITTKLKPDAATTPTNTMLSCTPACPNTRSEAKAQSISPVSGTIHYVVTNGGNSLADLTVAVDFGTVLAKATYKQAPSGA